MFATQLYHELYKMFARKRTYIGFGAFLTIQVIVLLMFQLPKIKSRIAGLLSSNGYDFNEFYGGLTLAMIIILFTFLLLGALYLALVAGDIVAKEVEEGTMRMVLSRPVSRLRIMLLKWCACSIYTFVLILFLGFSALVIATIYKGGLGKLFIIIPERGIPLTVYDTNEALWRYCMANVLLSICCQLIATVALMFSCFKMKPAAATILTLSFFFVDAVLYGIPYFDSYKHWFISHHTGAWLNALIKHVPWPSLIQSLVILTALNITCWIIGTVRFCTRDLKT